MKLPNANATIHGLCSYPNVPKSYALGFPQSAGGAQQHHQLAILIYSGVVQVLVESPDKDPILQQGREQQHQRQQARLIVPNASGASVCLVCGSHQH